MYIPTNSIVIQNEVIYKIYLRNIRKKWVIIDVGGCIFNYLNEMNGNIYPSWFVHMFANFGINTVGFILFGVI